MAETEKSIVKFDSHCRLCRGAVAFAQSNDRKGEFQFEALDSSSADTIQLIDNSGQYHRSSAVIKIAAELRPPWSLLRHLRFIPLKWRDAVYNFVARHRISWFGRHP